MSAIHTDVSPAGMVQAVEENLSAVCRLLYSHIPGAYYQEDPELICWATGLPHPVLNGATRARLTPENADARLEELIALFRKRGVPAMWWYDPSSQPTDLGARLEAHGFTRGKGMPGMALDLQKPQAPLALSPALAIRKVTDEATLRLWIGVLCRGYGLSEQIGESFFTACVQIGLGPDSPARHFLCTLDGEPAACASLCAGAGIGGIYNVATLPEARRQGCGALVTQACLDAAREDGYRVAILQASEMGEPVYRRLGFEEACRIETYFWGVPA